MSGRLYTVTIGTPTATSAALDVFEFRNTAASLIELVALELWQETILTDANEFIARVNIIRGIGFTSGSGGETPTPAPVVHSDVAASFGADARNTTQAATGLTTMHSGGWNLRGPYLWVPPEDCRIQAPAGATNGIIVAINDPGTSVVVGGTAYVKEYGT